MSVTHNIKSKATELGFDFVGIAAAGPLSHTDAFTDWLSKGYHGEMEWLGRDPQRRINPENVLPGARSVVVVGWSYFIENPPLEIWNDPARGRIARYAWGPDYHDVITPKVAELADFIRNEAGRETGARYYVDTGPVLEREWAARAGVGFIGKNSLLINPSHGSMVFLSEILTTAELEPSGAAVEGGAQLPFRDELGQEKIGSCGSCRRCLDVCPTHAFPAPYILNGQKCISYLTIELKGSIPKDLRPKMGNWIYGCDECQSICPWVHRYSKPNERPFLDFDPDWAVPNLLELMVLDDEGFRERFKKTPIKRTKRRGLLRNVAVALGNWGSNEALPVLEKALSDSEPLIVEHAHWALAAIRSPKLKM